MNSRMYLETAVGEGKTYIKDMFFKAPYKVMSPFEKNGEIEIMLMSASAGLLAGDVFESELIFRENSKVLYTSQSYEKVFNTKDKDARKITKITVEDNAFIKYMPYPVIPFADSDFKNYTIVNLSAGSKFVYCDIFSCGRTGMGEYFAMKKMDSRFKVYVGEKLAFADRTLLEPQLFEYKNIGFWQDFTHCGMMYIYVQDKIEEKMIIENIREKNAQDKMLLGATNCENGIVVRVMANSGEEIYKTFRNIAENITGDNLL